MKISAKFEKFICSRFRATLNFQLVKVALNPLHRIFLNFAESLILECLLHFRNKNSSIKGIPMSGSATPWLVSEIQRLLIKRTSKVKTLGVRYTFEWLRSSSVDYRAAEWPGFDSLTRRHM